MNPRVTKAVPKNNYQVALHFDNGEDRIFDVLPYLDQGIFTQLNDPALFYSVKVVDGTIQWQNEADFCPDTLYLESKPL